jgi:hypothetical protein
LRSPQGVPPTGVGDFSRKFKIKTGINDQALRHHDMPPLHFATQAIEDELVSEG